MTSYFENKKGFSMVELLVAMAILAGVTAAIFSLYNMQHKVTHIEQDVVEVQQNLKAALDTFTRDMRMAGFLVPLNTNRINATADNTGLNNTDTVTLNTSSATGAVARLNMITDLTTNVSTTANITFTVATAGEVNLFSVGDIARIIIPGDKSQPVNAYFTVSAKDSTVPSITLTPSANGTDITFKKGYMIARTGTAAPDTFPNTVRYCVGPAATCAPNVTDCPTGQSCLMRILNNDPNPGNDSIVATNIQDFQIKYISDGSTAEADTPADLSAVRAVRVSLTGQTAATAGLSNGAKTRSVTTIAKIRNR